VKSISLWAPTGTMLLVSFISYVDRNTLALLAPTILRETGLSGEQYGFVISAFSAAYMIGNPLWGWILDRWGLRSGMTVAVSFWTLASTAHAVVSSFPGFAIARAALGFGEGATFPGGLRAAVQTLPPSKRSRGMAVAYSGGSLGAIVTPIIVTPIALWWGWRTAFLFTGLIGLLWLTLWAFISRRPDIRHHRTEESAAEPGDSPRLRDRRIWSFGLLYAAGALPIAFVIYGSALYLSNALGASQAVIGGVLWIPPLGWEIGYFFWGWLADKAAAKGGSRLGDLKRLMGAIVVIGFALALTPWLQSFVMAMALYFLAMFCASGFIILSIAYATDVYSSRYSGLISGVGSGAWSATVALIMPLFGRLFDQGRWETAFALAAAIPAVGYLVWLVINRGEDRSFQKGLN